MTMLARRTDPQESHDAALRVAPKLSKVRRAVLILVREEPLSVGTELNAIYRLRYERRGWPRVAYDTPRKRLSTLHVLGMVEPVGSKDGERQWIITELGLTVIA